MAERNGSTVSPRQCGDSSSSSKDDRYDPDQFLISASDANGHNARIWCRVQPGITQQIDYVVTGRAFPYKSKGDLIRHAVHRHLAWLGELEPIRSVMGQVDAINEVMREEEFASSFRSVFEKMGVRIAEFMGSGSDGEARRMVLTVLRMVGEMPDGYWRDKYAAEIKARWGHLVDKAPRASLLSNGESENP